MPRAVLGLLLAAAQPVFAEAPPIIVTGRALPAVDPAPVLLDEAHLLGVARRLDVALAREPSLQLFRRASSESASQTAQGLSLRGLGGSAASRMLVTLDGVPQNDLFAGWIAFAATPVARLEAARIDPGAAAPMLFAGMAPGGTVALQSAPPGDALASRAGSRRAVDAAAAILIPAGNGAIELSAAHARGDGALLVDPAVAGPADVPARFRQAQGALRMLAPAGPDTELQLRAAAFDDRRRRGTRDGLSSARGADASLRLVHRGPWAAEALVFAQLRDFSMRAVAIGADRTTATVTLDQFATPAAGWGAGLLLRPPPAGDTRFDLGADWRAASAVARERFGFVGGRPQGLRTAGGRQREAGLFAGVHHQAAHGADFAVAARLQPWWLEGGVLREVQLASGAVTRDARAPDRHGIGWAGRLGAGWRPPAAAAWRLHVTASRGERLPTLNELHRPFRIGSTAVAANPQLQPERLRMLEAGVDWMPLSTLSAGVRLFDARLDGAIANVTIGAGPGVFPSVGFVPAGGEARVRSNLAAIRSRGAEARAAVDAGAWRLEAALATADARVDGGAAAPSLTGLRPAQVPAWGGTATLAFTPAPAARLALTVAHQAARFEDDRNRRRLAPATTLDASVRWPVAPGLALTLDAENLTDATVETGFLGNAVERSSPRSLWLGVMLKPVRSR